MNSRARAVKFFKDTNNILTTETEKIEFLRSKGLTDEEILEARVEAARPEIEVDQVH